jgi:dipeptidase
MDHLTQTYGYASDGESFSIADPKEIWLMEMVSKGDPICRCLRPRTARAAVCAGKYGVGSVWVASRVPDGMICAHSNQARTLTFAQNDPDNVLFAADVVTFAQVRVVVAVVWSRQRVWCGGAVQSVGLYPSDSPAAAFSFSDVYDPLTFGVRHSRR